MKAGVGLKGLSGLALAALLLAVAAAAPVGWAKPTEADLAKVKEGMARVEVLQLLGKPDRDQVVREADGLCRLYAYKKVGRYKLVNIWFDCDDRVKEIDKIT